MRPLAWRGFSILLFAAVTWTFCRAEEDRKELKEPVYRVRTASDPTPVPSSQPVAANQPVNASAPAPANQEAPAASSTPMPAVPAPADPGTGTAHPLDPALDIAAKALALIQSTISDYTCTLVKQERINGTVQEPEFVFTKVRNRKVEGSRIVVPFSVYMKFIKPDGIRGREVIYVENQNDGKMVAHEGGVKGKFIPSVWLSPESALAMRNNRYPITEVGVLTLTERLIDRGNRDRKHPDCTLEFLKNAKINGRPCTCLQVQHPVRRPYYAFHLARVFVDDELGVPVRYESYDWPVRQGGPPQLIESYTYLNMQVNVGLTDEDFDHTNPNYNF
jgi:hypothetical protein